MRRPSEFLNYLELARYVPPKFAWVLLLCAVVATSCTACGLLDIHLEGEYVIDRAADSQQEDDDAKESEVESPE